MKQPRFNLFVLYTHDLDRAVQLYSALGLTFTSHRHGTGPHHYAAEIDDVVFEIYPAREPSDSLGYGRFGFAVADIEIAVTALVAQGAIIISAPHSSQWGHRAVLADPDGYRIELIEPDDG